MGRRKELIAHHPPKAGKDRLPSKDGDLDDSLDVRRTQGTNHNLLHRYDLSTIT
jgi:hypothetical protein